MIMVMARDWLRVALTLVVLGGTAMVSGCGGDAPVTTTTTERTTTTTVAPGGPLMPPSGSTTTTTHTTTQVPGS
jgi:hypothetical protein